MAWIETAEGIALPSPALESGDISISTIVDGGRNTNGDFIGQVIGNDKLKINVSFKALSPEQMKTFLALFDRRQGGKFVHKFRVFDPRINDFVYMDMYVGDRSGTPYMVDKTDWKPRYWINVGTSLTEI